MKNLVALTAAVALALASFAVIAGNHGSHKAEKNLVEVASSAGSFNTLLAALEAADLTETIAEGGPFTVFAPTDAAFAALPEGALDGLLKNPDQLKAVLTLHVVSGQAKAADVVGLSSVTTLAGSDLAVDTADGVKIGGANVVTTDVVASNGVIHVIDQVILPQS